MKRLLLVLLAGCGGAPFTTLVEDPVDAQTTTVATEASMDTMVLHPQADASAESESESGLPPEDGGSSVDVCAPPRSAASPDPAYCSGSYAVPTYYAEANPTQEACYPQEMTPAACLCDYTCDCIRPLVSCVHGGTFVSCGNPAGMVTVVCS